MSNQLKIKTCDPPCGKPLLALTTPQSGLEHSEWYCRDCHKSYSMDEFTARALASQEVQRRPQQPGA